MCLIRGSFMRRRDPTRFRGYSAGIRMHGLWRRAACPLIIPAFLRNRGVSAAQLSDPLSAHPLQTPSSETPAYRGMGGCVRTSCVCASSFRSGPGFATRAVAKFLQDHQDPDSPLSEEVNGGLLCTLASSLARSPASTHLFILHRFIHSFRPSVYSSKRQRLALSLAVEASSLRDWPRADPSTNQPTNQSALGRAAASLLLLMRSLLHGLRVTRPSLPTFPKWSPSELSLCATGRAWLRLQRARPHAVRASSPSSGGRHPRVHRNPGALCVCRFRSLEFQAGPAGRCCNESPCCLLASSIHFQTTPDPIGCER
eukprot:GHVU01121687.1.p1 GENE.GHVU01121687.1~~GHVU01121687.1.p1  ORF type:complete len:313 (+),score=6.94 GHVU01121687.1:527-1465(+)